MINVYEIRDAIRTRIFESGIFDLDEISYENKTFNPAGKTKWLNEYYLQIGETSLSDKSDDLQGIFQYTINVPINTGDTLCDSIARQVGDLFGTREVVTTDSYRFSISNVERTFQGRLQQDSIWYSIVIDINFRVFGK